MATDLEKLVVQMEASLVKFERQMNKASGVASASARKIETRFAKMNQTLGGQFMGLGKSIAAGLGVGIGIGGAAGLTRQIQETIKFADSIAKTADAAGISTNALQEYRYAAGLAGLETAEFDKAAIRLARTLGEAARGKDAPARVFESIGISIRDSIGNIKSTEQVLDEVVEAFAKIPDAARRASLAQELFGRDGVKMAVLLRDGSKSIEEMRQRARDLGLVLEEDLLRSAEKINDRFDTLVQTITTGFKRSILETADAVTGRWDQAMRIVESSLEAIGVKAETASKWVDVLGATLKSLPPFGLITSILGGAGALMDDADPQSARDKALQELAKKLRDQQRARAQAEVDDDFGSARSGSSGSARISAYERETQAILARTEAMRLEAEIYGRTTFEIERARTARDLENAAIADGIELTPELRANIDQLATAYAMSVVELENVTEAQQRAQAAAEEFKATAKDIMSGFISDLRNGVSAADALANALNRVLDKLIDIALNAAFSGLGGGAGGFLGALFPRRERGGPVTAGRPYIVGERRPELFVPNQSGTILPRVPQVSAAGGGEQTVRVIVEGRPGKEFDAVVTQIAGDVAGKVSVMASQQAVGRFSRNELPGRLQEIQMRNF